MSKSRRALGEYARIVALSGPNSDAAESFRRAKAGDDDFTQLARLTDFAFEQYNRLTADTAPDGEPVASAR